MKNNDDQLEVSFEQGAAMLAEMNAVDSPD